MRFFSTLAMLCFIACQLLVSSFAIGQNSPGNGDSYPIISEEYEGGFHCTVYQWPNQTMREYCDGTVIDIYEEDSGNTTTTTTAHTDGTVTVVKSTRVAELICPDDGPVDSTTCHVRHGTIVTTTIYPTNDGAPVTTVDESGIEETTFIDYFLEFLDSQQGEGGMGIPEDYFDIDGLDEDVDPFLDALGG